jgi:small subunit ribosomal protein S2
MTDEKFLIPTDEYLKSGIHIGTKFKTKYMEKFIYKTRPDGLSVLNLQKIDERLGVAARFLAQYDPKDILIVGRRESAWKPLTMFGKVTGVKVFAGRYPPGVLTNPKLDKYMEIKLLMVVDAGPDRNVIVDATKMGVPVIGICDTNNQSNNIDLVVPANNKGKKSLGLLFWILAREYLKNRGIIKKDDGFLEKKEDFTEE